MATLPEIVKKAWEDREPGVVLTTVDAAGRPNAIYATCVSVFGNDTIVVANNYFVKTMENRQAGSKASVLFIPRDHRLERIPPSANHYLVPCACLDLTLTDHD